MALSTVGKHYTPVWQRIQEAIDAHHIRAMPLSVWQGAVGRAGHQDVSLSKGESKSGCKDPSYPPLRQGTG
jgi:hypothetical protein